MRVCLFLTCWLVITVTGQAQLTLTNGSFEDGATGWTGIGSQAANSFYIETDAAWDHDTGTKHPSTWFDGTVTTPVSFYQDLTGSLAAGKFYTFDAWVNWDFWGACDATKVSYEINLLVGGTVVATVPTQITAAMDALWFEQQIIYTAQAADAGKTVRIEFVFHNAGAQNYRFTVDDVSLSISDTPLGLSVINGGFEDGIIGWEYINNGINWYVDTTVEDTHEGSRNLAAWHVANPPMYPATVAQTLQGQLVEGKYCVLSFWLKTGYWSTGHPPYPIHEGKLLIDGQVVATTGAVTEGTAYDHAWNQYRLAYRVQAADAGKALRFELTVNANGSQNFSHHLDQVEISVSDQEAIQVNYTNAGGTGRWSDSANWDNAIVPGLSSMVHLSGARTALIDAPAPDIDTLYITNTGQGDYGDGTLNLSGSGALTVNGVSDWSYFGQGEFTARVNLSGNASLTFRNRPVLFHHSGSGQAVTSINDTAQMTVENYVYLYNGRSTTNLAGGTLMAGGLFWGTGANVINISQHGRLLVKQNAYSIAKANADITAGRIVAADDAQVSTVNTDGSSYTQITSISKRARNPLPADSHSGVPATVVLDWDAPADVAAPTYNLYLDTNPSFPTGPRATGLTASNFNPDPDLTEAIAYYWRVDVLETSGSTTLTHTGPLWSFATVGLASNPQPPDQAQNVKATPAMSWTPDQTGLSFDLYLGTDAARVAAAGTADSEYKGRRNTADYIPVQPLNHLTTYYWRVDEVQPGAPPKVWKGVVWRFKTIRQPITYYVSTSGSDANSGTQALPFATIQKAASLMQAGDTCLIRAGTYRETVSPAASGLPDAPITFRAYPGEQATVSGADLLQAIWNVHQGKIYKATTSREFTQLFVDGVMMNEARWPNMAPLDFFNQSARATMDNGDTLHVYDNGLPPGDWTGAIVNIVPAWEWIAFTRRVAAYVPGQSLTFDQPSPHAGEHGDDPGTIDDMETIYRPRQGNPYYIFGALAGLDTANEWFLNTQTDVVYLWTPDGTSPANHTVEVKQRAYAFELGEKSYINIEKLNIFAAAIDMHGGYCVVDGVTMLYPNHFREAPILHIWPIGTPNVMAGSHNEWRNSVIAYSACDGIKMHGSHNKVANCLIHDVAYTGVYAACVNSAGVVEGDTISGEISRNTMYNSGRFIIMHHGMRDSLVTLNNMFMPGLLTRDAGVTYSSFTGGYCTFSHNWVHDHTRPAGGGLYVDEFNPPNDFHHNAIWNCIFGFQMNINNNHLLSEPDTRFYNNTVMSSPGACITNNGDNGRFINNILNPGAGATWRRDRWSDWTIRNNWVPVHPQPADGLARINETERKNYSYPLDTWLRPPQGSSAIDAGDVLTPYTDGYAGAAPDIGAYETGGDYWLPGSTLDPRPIFSYLPGSPSPVESTSPADLEEEVPPGLSSIAITFVPRMDPATLGGFTINGGLSLGAPVLSNSSRTVTLSITGALQKDRTYTVTIPASVRPVEGVCLLDSPFTFSFSTSQAVAAEPVAWWRFTEGAGSTAADTAGGDHPGTLLGGASWVNGWIGMGLSLDGVNDYVTILNPSTLSSERDFTWAAWIKTTAAKDGTIIGRAPASGTWDQDGRGGKALYVTGAGRLRFDAAWVNSVESSRVINDGKWHHVAVTVDFETNGANDTSRLYIDGQPDGMKADWNVNTYSETGLALKLGYSNTDHFGYFNGALDEVRIYDRVLSASQVAKLAAERSRARAWQYYD